MDRLLAGASVTYAVSDNKRLREVKRAFKEFAIDHAPYDSCLILENRIAFNNYAEIRFEVACMNGASCTHTTALVLDGDISEGVRRELYFVPAPGLPGFMRVVYNVRSEARLAADLAGIEFEFGC